MLTLDAENVFARLSWLFIFDTCHALDSTISLSIIFNIVTINQMQEMGPTGHNLRFHKKPPPKKTAPVSSFYIVSDLCTLYDVYTHLPRYLDRCIWGGVCVHVSTRTHMNICEIKKQVQDSVFHLNYNFGSS